MDLDLRASVCSSAIHCASNINDIAPSIWVDYCIAKEK